MSYKSYIRRVNGWRIPALYSSFAIFAGLTLPRIEHRVFPHLVSSINVSTAATVYSTIGSGMIALTGIVFSLAFVMVQFSATAYSPRLVAWIEGDPVMWHAMGVFMATFLYAIAALARVDFNGSGNVPFLSQWLVVGLLLVSVGMFIALVQRIGLLQINRMLAFTGDQGRRVIATLYPVANSAVGVKEREDFRKSPPTQTLIYKGGPRSIQSVDTNGLMNLAEGSGGIIDLAVAVGDTIQDSMIMLQVFGSRTPIDERKLRGCVYFGTGRTFEQDPKYAIRLLVDIAIRALSPAVNDPTTAVQALDQIEDLLLRLGQRHLEIGKFCDSDGELRLLVPFPAWDDIVLLAFGEICFCGATSVQVMRRMNALVSDLIRAVPEERRPALRSWDTRLKATISRSFRDAEEKSDASREDRQGLGMPRPVFPEASKRF
jgi:uncharacterized membrane protein